MAQTIYLIESAYGWAGTFGGRYFSLICHGSNLWYILHDGTPESKAISLIEAQAGSSAVRFFRGSAEEYGIPFDYARWLNFQVIDKWETD
jgi:hypothetical protein